MTALRFFSTSKPSLIGAPVQPMSKDDRNFWRIWNERKQKEQSNEARPS